MRRNTLAALALAPLVLAGAARAACPDDAAMAAMAASLLNNTPVPPPAPGMSLAEGLCAQNRLVPIMERSLGRVVGWKVGLTNDAAQTRFRTPHPLAAPIYEATVRARSGDTLPARFAAVPVVESDLLVRVRDAGINTAGADHVAILRHLDQVIPFIELPDLALADLGQMDGPNLLAVGVGARLGVVGEAFEPPATAEFAARLGSMRVRLVNEQRELSEAPGTALLGHPLNVIPWLVGDLAARGTALKPGDLISLGGFSPALPAEAGRTVTATYTGLREQPVSVSVSLR
ncbi:2-keto-4-pentenoate hydratase [Roseomonas sp. BN140053]|uniref:2-keto-4-pentenoate hydratase n=1 Tax=Roseomonas sp. BN140053 TaxID=3391898 RepID=UPI0039E92916